MERLYFVKIENDKWFLAENIKYYFLKVPVAKLDSSEFNNMINDKQYVLENHILYHEIARLWDKLYKDNKFFKKLFSKIFFWRDLTILIYWNKKDAIELLEEELNNNF